jgi:hypothetical protein
MLVCKLLQTTDTLEQAKYINLIKTIDDWKLSLMTPKNLDSHDPDNFILKIERSFENLCGTLEDLGVSNPKRLTVFEFYSRIDFYRKKLKPKQQPSK